MGSSLSGGGTKRLPSSRAVLCPARPLLTTQPESLVGSGPSRAGHYPTTSRPSQ